ARWRSETHAWHEELVAVVRLPDAAARRRCEATLRTDRLVTPMTAAVPRVIRARISYLFPPSSRGSQLRRPLRRSRAHAPPPGLRSCQSTAGKGLPDPDYPA